MSRIFISYRRDDSAGWAGRLAKDLVEQFGSEAVFQDIEDIGAGQDFVAVIDKVLESCSAVLVLIGPKWSVIEDKRGARRLEDPSDTVRLEIAQALKREAVLVIPVLLGGAKMPSMDELPGELASLAHRNAIELSDKRWNYDLKRLSESLVKSAGLAPAEKAATPAVAPAGKRRFYMFLAAVLTLLISIAVYFLIDRPGAGNTFEVFSIDRPVNDDELPLGEHQTWMLEGRLQVADGKQVDSGAPEINIEVFKLPDRAPVLPQNGKLRISTERGLWRFESAKFSGAGSYEVLATVTLGERSDWRSIIVTGIPKSIAFHRAIERDRESRGAATSRSSLEQLTPSQLSELYKELDTLQREFWKLFSRGDLDEAEANVSRTLDLLDPVLPLHPNDWYLQNMRAYTFKNYALVMRELGRSSEFDRALGEAEKMFEVIREQKPNDPGAWNGLGSVAALRGEYTKALYYIDRALEIKPDYSYAIQDREKVVEKLKTEESD